MSLGRFVPGQFRLLVGLGNAGLERADHAAESLLQLGKFTVVIFGIKAGIEIARRNVAGRVHNKRQGSVDGTHQPDRAQQRYQRQPQRKQGHMTHRGVAAGKNGGLGLHGNQLPAKGVGHYIGLHGHAVQFKMHNAPGSVKDLHQRGIIKILAQHLAHKVRVFRLA